MKLVGRVISLLLVCLPATGWAQNLAAQETTVPGGVLMLAAYIALWLMIVGYLVVLSKRQASVDADLEKLRNRLDALLDVDET